MKRLFSFLLVMVLITSVFSLVGCNGLWGFDDDDDVSVADNRINFNLGDVEIDLDPAGPGSIRAAIMGSALTDLKGQVWRQSTVVGVADAIVLDNIAVDKAGVMKNVTFRAEPGSFYIKVVTNIKLANDAPLTLYVYTGELNASPAAPAFKITEATTAVGIIIQDNLVKGQILVADKDIKADDPDVQSFATKLDTFFTATPITSDDVGKVSLPPLPVMVTGVTLNFSTLNMSLTDNTANLVANVEPFDAAVKTVKWSSSNDSVASVTAGATAGTAVVKALSAGSAVITVTTDSGNKTAVCNVTVSAESVAATAVSFNKNAMSLENGKSEALVVSFEPANATNIAVNWNSSNNAVATVLNGVITAVAPGQATVTATLVADNTKKAECLVTVTGVAVTGVTLDKLAVSVVKGGNVTLTANVLPTNASDKTVTWSSDKNNIATVDANGKVTAVAVGTAKITVTTTDGSKTAVCDVTVTPIPVTGVSLDKTTASLFVGNTVTLTPTVSPAEADNKNVTWSTSNSTVATVNNGVVTGAAAGVATITVTTVDQSKTATCLVTVAAAPIAITGVAVSPATLGLTVGGQTSTLSVVYTPANANTQKSVAWSTSNSAVAGVNATTGVVSPVAVGVATITVTVVDTSDVSRTATCFVTVSPAPVRVTGVTVNPTTLSLSAGGATGSITPTVLPGDASNKNVTWGSSAEAVATVANGVVTPLSAGVATITVTTVDGGKTATCLVTVGAAPQSQTTVTFNNPVEGLSTGDMKIYITAGTNTSFNASTFIATTTVVVVDPDSDTGEANKRFVKVSESTDTRVVLMNNGLPFSIKSFQSLTFTTAIPAGAKVEIIKWLGSSGEVVSTSNNL